PHLKADWLDDKLGILDVKIHTTTGKVIDVEIQVAPTAPMRERLIFYLAKMVTEQIGEGYDYAVIKRVISVVITDFELIPKNPAYHHVFRLYDRKHESEFSDLIEVNTLELPKLPKRKDKSKLYDWLQFFKTKKEEELEMLASHNPMIGKAVGILKKLSVDERTRMLAEKQEMLRMDISASIKKGRAEGIAEGEARRAVEIARYLLGMKIPISEIAAATNFSRKEIEKLL
ncbi:MAG: Rpn family recombination-promoting nuclease/putative transposase, partial [Planctomycetaceae bacterium]|nr:Rpn family recombination-promoting nuclease/putative transposase [Planctomycetaceae bacterium]